MDHSNGAHRQQSEFNGQNGSQQQARGDEIAIKAGQLTQALDPAESILLPHAAEQQIFQHAGELRQVITLDQEIDQDGKRLPKGALMVAPVTALNIVAIKRRSSASGFWNPPSKPI